MLCSLRFLCLPMFCPLGQSKISPWYPETSGSFKKLRVASAPSRQESQPRPSRPPTNQPHTALGSSVILIRNAEAREAEETQRRHMPCSLRFLCLPMFCPLGQSKISPCYREISGSLKKLRVASASPRLRVKITAPAFTPPH